MTDREKLLVSMWCDEDAKDDGELSALDVMAMLFVLGQEQRRAVPTRRTSCRRLILSGTSRSAA